MTAVSVGEGSVASAAGLSPAHVAGGRALRALHAAERLARSRRTLAEREVGGGHTHSVSLSTASPRGSVTTKQDPGASRSTSVRLNLCLYCGDRAKQRGVCPAHTDLPARDPWFHSVLACTQGGTR